MKKKQNNNLVLAVIVALALGFAIGFLVKSDISAREFQGNVYRVWAKPSVLTKDAKPLPACEKDPLSDKCLEELDKALKDIVKKAR